MELHDAEEAMGIRKTRIHKPRRALSRFARILMELCTSKGQLALLQKKIINGVANPEIFYMLLHFQILCID